MNGKKKNKFIIVLTGIAFVVAVAMLISGGVANHETDDSMGDAIDSVVSGKIE